MELNRVTPVRIAVLAAMFLAISWVASLHPVRGDAPGVSLAGVNAGAQTFFFDAPASRFTTFAAGTQLSNPTSNTTFDQFYTIPPNDPHLVQPSAGFQVLATGNVTFGAAGAYTMSVNVAEAVLVQATVNPTSSLTNVPWLLRGRFTTQSPGSSGLLNGHCELYLGQVAGSPTNAAVAIGVIDPPKAVDTTVANDVGVGALFSVSNASNKVIMKYLQVSTTR